MGSAGSRKMGRVKLIHSAMPSVRATDHPLQVFPFHWLCVFTPFHRVICYMLLLVSMDSFSPTGRRVVAMKVDKKT